MSRAERAPRLVLRFAVFTALGLAAAAAAILVVVRQADTVQAEREAITRARLTTNAVLVHELLPSDLMRPVRIERRRQLDRIFARGVTLEGTLRGTLYTPSGRASYSTDHRLIGRRAPQPRYVDEALTGTVVSQLTNAALGSGRVLRTYVPVGLGPKRVPGVVALDQDYAPIAAAGGRSAWLIAGVLEGLLLILIAVLVPVLARVSRRIRQHVAELEHAATHDDRTGLPNRLGFVRAIDATTADADGASFVVLLINIDGFREINDAVGVENGDALLAQVAERLRSEFTDASIVARIGGDEFGALLTRTHTSQDLETFARRTRRALEQTFHVHGIAVALGARIGAALIPEHGTEVDTLMRRASVAISIAKHNETDFEIYDAGHDSSDVSRLALAAELREALHESQLIVYYQPQADFATRAVRGVEALLRWQHPTRGLLSAGEFIAEAERTGVVKDIGRFVLETSARQWQEWSALGLSLDLAVNLAAVDMFDTSLPDEIATLLARNAMPPEHLVLEITERTLVRDERRTSLVLERLRRIGVRIAIDDFGTGYSSLAYLRRLPVNQVKLDGSFIEGIPHSANDEAIVRGTVELSHALGATVVAEGIETQDQWDCVAALGCDIAQGYLIGRPVPAEKLAPLVATRPGMPRLLTAV